jgi:hypothetical protein
MRVCHNPVRYDWIFSGNIFHDVPPFLLLLCDR